MKMTLLAILCLTSIQLFAHFPKLMYVCDQKDMYVNVRSENNVKSPIVDTVYHLQLVCVNEYKDGWYNTSRGYIHESRLVELPSQVSSDEDLLSVIADLGVSFIASVDCPQFILELERGGIKFLKLNDIPILDGMSTIVGYSSKILISNFGEHGVYLYKTTGEKQYITGAGPICTASSIAIVDNHVEIHLQGFRYSYGLNRFNKPCQYVLADYHPQPLHSILYNETMNKARQMMKILNKENITPDNYKSIETKVRWRINDELKKIIGVNNFEYWSQLENIYFNHNAELDDYYPIILCFYPIDGEGSHEIEFYANSYYGFICRGEIEVENVGKIEQICY